ncbi:MAG: hypothetical protein IJ608_09735 [Lachnospiraceae bacterium]|nr:hypothetical protein [Lachnospiraceae bacterium]
MNQLKSYIQSQLSEIHLSKPKGYSDSFYQEIHSSEDVENTIVFAENMMKSYEEQRENFVFGYMADVDDREVAVYKAYKALEKVGMCLSDVSVIPSLFVDVTQERFVEWLERFQSVRDANGKLNSDYLSRPD